MTFYVETDRPIYQYLKKLKLEELIVWWSEMESESDWERIQRFSCHNDFAIDIAKRYKGDNDDTAKDRVSAYCKRKCGDIITNKQLEKINGSRRLKNFFINDLFCSQIRDKPYNIPDVEIMMLFYVNVLWRIRVPEKTKYIEDMEERWSREIIAKKINNFIKENDEYFLNWAHGYINESKTRIRLRHNSPFSKPISPKEIYDYILLCLDISYLENRTEHQLLTIQMRKAFSQKKFRDADKVKKNYHIPLTKLANQQLEWLAKFHDISISAALEKLIAKEYQLIQLDEKGKRQYDGPSIS